MTENLKRKYALKGVSNKDDFIGPTQVKNNTSNDSTAPSGVVNKDNIWSTQNNTSNDSMAQYNAQLNNYIAAQNALNTFNSKGPFSFSQNDRLNEVKDSINNFSYDVNADALYQQYVDQYSRQGKMASEDVMGQAAAMTGGYGNSYANTVGNQAYQAYIQQLNDKVPELSQLSKQNLYDEYAMLLNEYDREYGKYSEEYNRLLDNLNTAKDEYQSSVEAENETKSLEIPDNIQKKLESFESNIALANYLDGLVSSGVITEADSDAWYAQYVDENEKYVLNDDGSRKASYKDMLSSFSGWSVVDNGGMNWFGVGIDANAIVKAPNGDPIRLDNLREQLKSEGMSTSEANKLIKSLMEYLDI